MANGKEIDLTLLGGEPLLNRSVYLLLMDYVANDNDIKISMTTNGTIWDDDILQRVKEKQVNLSISIDGNEETHLKNRKSVNGMNLYGKTMDTIETLLKNGVFFGVRMTVARNTVSDFFDNILFFYNIGIKRISAAINEFEEWDKESLEVLDDQLSKIDNWYVEHIDEGISIDLYDGKWGEVIVCRERRFCAAGTKNHFVINSDGKIFPCSYVVDDSVWEIGSIDTGIDERGFKEILGKYLIREKACPDCNINYCCISTRCGFKNYKLTGWINKASANLCNIEKIVIKHNKKVLSALLEKRNPKIIKIYDYLSENGYGIRQI